MASMIEAFEAIDHDRPVCFIAYTIKGVGLPMQGHKDNHAGLMTVAQMEKWRAAQNIRPGHEWDRFEGLRRIRPAWKRSSRSAVQPRGPPLADRARDRGAARARLQACGADVDAAGLWLILNELARGDSELASRIVTTSPDVTVSTNLGAWVNRRGLFAKARTRPVPAGEDSLGLHLGILAEGTALELGIAEMNLFIMLSALGLSHSINGARLLPVGTLYDPFIERGLDALNYACYPGCALHGGGDAIGHYAGAGRRRAPVDRHAADRHGAGWACLVRAGVSSMNSP
jgi:pyruvate dehydrogenase E1 component